MAKSCSLPGDELSPFHSILIFTVMGTECIVGIVANGFVVVINADEWIQNKAVSTSSRTLFFLSVSRIGLQGLMMLEMTFQSTSPHFYYEDGVYDTFKVSSVFLHYCRLWFSAWLSLFYFVKIANFSYRLFLKLKRRSTGLMPWLLWLSVFVALGCSMFFSHGVYSVYVNDSFPICSSNSTKKKYFAETNMVNLLLLSNLGIFMPLVMFILLITSVRRDTLPMTPARDPSMEAHMGAIRATSSFLVLYIFNAVVLYLYMSNIFDRNSSWNILCEVIMAAYPAGHSVLPIQDNSGLRRTKWLQSQAHLSLKE
ncbi:LOW QUALITY PROTEIN: taste receptor type 2 member 39-like [Molossus nigricans]